MLETLDLKLDRFVTQVPGGFFTKVVVRDISFQMKLTLHNLELQNSRYGKKSKGRSDWNLTGQSYML
jgi:hypothetical protein